jgi:hypothetical protein
MSTGRRTPEGLERSRKANWKHGRYSAEAIGAAAAVRCCADYCLENAKSRAGTKALTSTVVKLLTIESPNWITSSRHSAYLVWQQWHEAVAAPFGKSPVVEVLRTFKHVTPIGRK